MLQQRSPKCLDGSTLAKESTKAKASTPRPTPSANHSKHFDSGAGTKANPGGESITESRLRVLAQKPQDRQKVYSLHEPHIYCIAKDKEHKKYEFGTKASIAMGKNSGVIVAAVAHLTNQYDGHTLPEVLEQAEAVTGSRARLAIVDRGYRGHSNVDGTEILPPSTPSNTQSRTQRSKMRRRFRRRAAIEPVISHLKHDYRLLRCFLKGFIGDQMNLLLAAAAWNFRKWMREGAAFWLNFLYILIGLTRPTRCQPANG